MDHLVPRSLGGSSSESNIVTACVRCNCDKGELALEEYRVLLAMRGKKFSGKFMAALLAEAEAVQHFYGDPTLADRKRQAAAEAAALGWK